LRLGKDIRAVKFLKSSFSIAAPVVIVAAVFFLLGFSWRDVGAAGSSPRAMRAAMLSIPDRMERMVQQPAAGEGKIPVLGTFQDTLNNIIQNYYPEASTSKTTVVKTPTNELSGKVVVQTPSLDSKQLSYMGIRGVLAALDDPFTGFMDPDDFKRLREENDGNFVGIGAQLATNKKGQVYVREPLPDCPAIKAGVKKGDVIVKVGSKAVAGMEIDDVVKMIRGPENTKVTLTLARGKDQKQVVITMVRQLVDYRMVEHDILDKADGIGWLQLRQFNSKADEQMDEAMTDLESKKIRGLILDLRGNPGGLLESAVEIGSRFIKDGPVVIIQKRGGERELLNVDPSKHDHRNIPLVVLVDEMSASASEIVAGAIKDNGAGTLVGTRTFGKARVQTIVPLPGDCAVRITTAKYLTPKGVDINKKGIDPDIVVKMPDDLPDDEDPNTGRLKNDPQLSKAVEVMKGKLAAAGTGAPQARR